MKHPVVAIEKPVLLSAQAAGELELYLEQLKLPNVVIMHIETPESTIGIEQVREVQTVTRHQRQADDRLLVVFHSAHLLTDEAQNALLKLLEEPTAHLGLILATNQPQQLLPTVRSRLELVTLSPMSQPAFISHFKARNSDEAALNRAWHQSEGFPLLGEQLLSRSGEPPEELRAARTFLGGDTAQRLAVVAEVNGSRADSRTFIATLIQLLQAAIQIGADSGDTKRTERSLRALETAMSVESALQRNGSVKTHMLRLAVDL